MHVVFDQTRIAAVALASVRVLAFLVIAPPFSTPAFPMQIRVVLALALGTALVPKTAGPVHTLGTGELIAALVTEAAIGGLLGFLVSLAFAALPTAGALLDMFGGFSAAQQYDPAANIDGAPFARWFQMVSAALLFVTNAYQLVIGGLLRSFTAVPLATFPSTGSVTVPQTLLTALVRMLIAAAQIAGPIVVVLFLANIGLGLLSRAAPALNVYALGPPLLALLTVVLAAVAFGGLPSVLDSIAQSVSLMIAGR